MLEITDFMERYLVDQFATLEGVASVRMNGARRYAMRVWLLRENLAARQLTVADVENALLRENVELPAGRLESTEREFTLRTDTNLRTEEDFRTRRGARPWMAIWYVSVKWPRYASHRTTIAASRARTA
jgi:multidrug efflux pump